MKKLYFLLVSILVFSLCFSGCAEEPKEKYSEDEIIGLTSAEVIEKYGEFDRIQGTPGDDGLYRDCSCGYLVKEAQKGYFGTTSPEYLMIHFDENGIADLCKYEQVV